MYYHKPILTEKKCGKCEIVQPTRNFYPKRRSYASMCMSCFAEYYKERRKLKQQAS